MIYFFTAWDDNGNLGEAYNRCMSLLPNDNDYACFLDGDAVYTCSYFGKRLKTIVETNPQYSLYTCMTNRIGQRYQIEPLAKRSDSMKVNRAISDLIWKKYNTTTIDVTDQTELSGVLMLLTKATWKQMGYFRPSGILGVDTDVHNRIRHINGRIGLMRGFLVQHWYRGG